MDHEEVNRWEDRLRKEFDEWTPRAARADRFATQIIGQLIDFLPRDRECMRRIEHELRLTAFIGDYEIAKVPPERDAQQAMAMKAMSVCQPTIVTLDSSGGLIDKPDKSG